MMQRLVTNRKARASKCKKGRELKRNGRWVRLTKLEERQRCSTAPKIFAIIKPSGAHSATDSLVLLGTTGGELLFVQRSALIVSRPAERATTIGDADF